jgi:sugar-specific transcriptional regulator TrmB
MLEKTLKILGISEKETKVYQLIVERGKVSPAQISKLTKINRTTVYGVLKELVLQGLVVEDAGSKILYYLPALSNELEKVIKREKEKSEEKIGVLKKLQAELVTLPQSKNYSVPKIRFIDEVDIEDFLYESIPRWNESLLLHDKTWWGFQDHSFVEKFEKWIDYYWKHNPENVVLKLLTNDSEAEKGMRQKKYAKRREVRFFPNSQFGATEWVIGDYIIFIMTKDRPYYLIEIRDAVIAENTRELFKKLWKTVDDKYII